MTNIPIALSLALATIMGRLVSNVRPRVSPAEEAPAVTPLKFLADAGLIGV
jgi:hypothetical protein